MSPDSKTADPPSSSDTPTASTRSDGESESVETPKSYPDWRVEELARKYSDDEPIERERGFYHPYG